jgi:hypothetical protein
MANGVRSRSKTVTGCSARGKHIKIVMAIDADSGDIAEAPAIRKFAPVPSRACKPIAIAAFAQGDGHQLVSALASARFVSRKASVAFRSI